MCVVGGVYRQVQVSMEVRAFRSLVLELPMAVTCSLWVLGTQ